MAIGSGIAAQLGFAKEATAGTRETPDHFIEFVQEGVALTVNRIERTGLRAGRRMNHGWAAGVQQVGGQIAFDLTAETVGELLELCIGDVNTTGAGDPYTHTFTPGDLHTGTFQIGRPSLDGTVRPFDYIGCFVSSWEIAVNPDEFVRMSVDIVGQDEDTAQSLASASYSQTNFFTFAEATLTVAAAEVCVDTFTMTGDNGLEVINKVCSTNPGFPTIRESGMRTYGGTFTADFDDLTAYNRFVNGTEAALVIDFESSADDKLTITTNVRFDGETPTVPGAETLRNTLPFVVTSGTSDAAAFTAVLLNGDSTP